MGSKGRIGWVGIGWTADVGRQEVVPCMQAHTAHCVPGLPSFIVSLVRPIAHSFQFEAFFTI